MTIDLNYDIIVYEYDIGGISMKKILKLIPLIAVLIGLLIIPVRVRALDFGDFSGDSDYGDSGDSWDSGWDSGNSGGGWDSDRNNRHKNSSGESIPMDENDFIIFFSVLGVSWSIAIILFIIHKIREKKRMSKTEAELAYKSLSYGQQLKPIAEYAASHPEFSEFEFKKKLSDLYVLFQKGWQAKNIFPLRQYMTDAFFAQMDTQLSSYRMKRETNYIDDIYVISVDLVGYSNESGFDIIVARLKTRIVDYVKDDYSGRIIRGSNTDYKIMTYGWTLVKRSDFNATRLNGTTEQICPKCGARVDVNQSAVCNYCGTVIKAEKFDWAVRNIRGISQRTVKKSMVNRG